MGRETERTGMMSVNNLGGDRFVIDIRGFRVEVDQPIRAGGTDLAPTPTELFVGSLVACVGFYAGRFLKRHGHGTDPLSLSCKFEMSEASPHRVAKIEITLHAHPNLTDHQRDVLLKVVDACTVHNSLRYPPSIQISLAEKPAIEKAAGFG